MTDTPSDEQPGRPDDEAGEGRRPGGEQYVKPEPSASGRQSDEPIDEAADEQAEEEVEADREVAAHEAEATPQASVKTTETAPAPRPVAPARAARPAIDEDDPPVAAAKRRKRPPFWAALAVAALPVWGIIYMQAMTKPSASATDPLVLGQNLYSQNCATCHGASGGGGVGPRLSGGAVLKAWPNYKDHENWVKLGTSGWTQTFPKRPKFGNGNPIAGGGNMPGFGSTLSADEITLVVYYERATLGGKAEPALVAAANTAAQTVGSSSGAGGSGGGASSGGG